MLNEDEIERWITWRGRHIPISKDGKIIKQNNYENVKKLSDIEYNVLCEEFEETLTDKEKELLKSYGIGGGYSSILNDPQWRDLERTYRIKSDNEKGYIEKKLSFYEALKENLDDKLPYLKSGDSDKDDVIRWNYEQVQSTKTFLKNMDEVFDKKGIALEKDIIVFRKGHENLEDLQNGAKRYGYTSTSAKSRINKTTPGHLKLGDNEFEIIIPRGMKILPMKNLVPDDVKYQDEILLPRNIKFTLLKNKSSSNKYNYEKMKFEKGKNKFLVVAEKEK